MNIDAHIKMLKVKHAQIDSEIQRQENILPVDERRLHELKRQKLKIKDEMNSLKKECISLNC